MPHHLSNAEKEEEVLPLYPEGWFGWHVFPHLKGIHSENVGSALKYIANVCARNDTYIHTELHERNLHNSHMVVKAHERMRYLKQ